MTTCEILRPVTPADLDIPPRLVNVLKSLPRQGRITSEHFQHMRKDRVSRGATHALSRGILRRILLYEQTLKLDSVKFWCTQFNKSGYKNLTTTSNTKSLYLRGLDRLNKWLPGRTFPSHETVMHDGQIVRQSITKSFANVEEMMEYCNESDYGTKTAQRVIREYMAGPQMSNMFASMRGVARSAVKSYFNVNGIVLDLPSTRSKRAEPAQGGSLPMTLGDFYKMLQKRRPGITMRTIMLTNLH